MQRNVSTRNKSQILFLKKSHLKLLNSTAVILIILGKLQVFLLLKVIAVEMRPSSNCGFDCHEPKGAKYVSHGHLSLCHSHEQKFQHNFQDLLNSDCNQNYTVRKKGYFYSIIPCL